MPRQRPPFTPAEVTARASAPSDAPLGSFERPISTMAELKEWLDATVLSAVAPASMADGERWFSGCLQHIQNSGGPAKEAESEAGSGDWLTGTIVGSEEVAEFIVFAAKAVGRIVLFEAAHTSDSSFDPLDLCLTPLSHWRIR